MIEAAAALVLGLALGLATASLIWRRRALDAIHEVRRPITALLLIAESLRGAMAPGELDALAGEAQNADGALADLASLRRFRSIAPGCPLKDAAEAALAWNSVARGCGRRVSFDVRTAATRYELKASLRPAISNLIANALEHSSGDVGVIAEDTGEGISIRVERTGDLAEGGRPLLAGGPVSRGRGTRIARAAARSAGARLELEADREAGARLEIPASARR